MSSIVSPRLRKLGTAIGTKPLPAPAPLVSSSPPVSLTTEMVRCILYGGWTVAITSAGRLTVVAVGDVMSATRTVLSLSSCMNEINDGSDQNNHQQQQERFSPYQDTEHDHQQPAPEEAYAFPPPQADQQTPPFFRQQYMPQPQVPQYAYGPYCPSRPPINGYPQQAMGSCYASRPPINGPALPNTQPYQYQWNSGLFDCCDNPENALVTLCFPCVTFGRIAEIIDQGQSSCGRRGFLYSLIWLCTAMPCLLSYGYRSKLRNQFGLDELPGSDFITHCFCECCALCQEYRELETRGNYPAIGWVGNASKMKPVIAGSIAMSQPVQPVMMTR